MLDKLIPFHQLERWRRNFNGTLVVTNGCFDILHAGHVDYLFKAAQMGALLVGLNSDASVRALKGSTRPINAAFDRATVLCSLESVFRVCIFDDLRADQFLHMARPHIYVKGGDYTEESLDPKERAALKEHSAQIFIIPALAGKSTTKLATAVQPTYRAVAECPNCCWIWEAIVLDDGRLWCGKCAHKFHPKAPSPAQQS